MPEISVQPFTNEDFGTIRALRIDNEPWFVARDVTDALGLDRTATRRMDDDEKGVRSMHTQGGEQDVSIITESGLYSLIMASKKPDAKRFKRWVTHDVLPSIRRHGIYATPQMAEAALENPDVLIAALTALKQERQKAEALAEDNARMLPKSTAYDAFIDTDGTITITQAARYLAQMDKTMTRKRLFGYLRADGIICKRDNAPTKRAIEQGLARQMMTTRSDGKANDPYAHLTQKGLDWCVTHYVMMPKQMHV